jgi:hypothetical protein
LKRKLIPMVLGLMALGGSAMALPAMLKVFESTYKVPANSNLHKASCAICHIQPPTLNPYGKDLKKLVDASGKKILTPEMLKKIEKLDSDKDGFTNIAEIKADTLPGDPTSKPAGKPRKK